MKINEILTEAKMDPDIRKALEAKGYKFLGKGQDQDAYRAPDGTILKIFGTDRDSSDVKYSRGQQSFIDFANYCMANANNPFLPQFGGWERFKFNGKMYLQIRCERMFEADSKKSEYFELPLEFMVNAIHRPADQIIKFVLDRLSNSWNEEDYAKFIMYIGGEDQLLKLFETMQDLYKISRQKGYGFDLHIGNFMLGSDGHLVINDPFFTGTWR